MITIMIKNLSFQSWNTQSQNRRNGSHLSLREELGLSVDAILRCKIQYRKWQQVSMQPSVPTVRGLYDLLFAISNQNTFSFK